MNIQKFVSNQNTSRKPLNSEAFLNKKNISTVLIEIEKKVIKIDKLLKTSLNNTIRDQERIRRRRETQESSDREKELEKKEKPKVKGNIKFKLPKAFGFFDWIKNFFVNVFLGFVSVRLIKFLPNLIGLLPIISKVMDFVIDVGGKLLNALVTLVDWGYKAYDASRGFVKNVFGEGEAKKFDELASIFNKFMNLAIIAGMAASGLGGGSGGGPRGRSGGGRRGVTRSGGGRAGRPDFRNPLRERPNVTTSGGGRAGRPDFRNPLRSRPNITGDVAEGAENIASKGAGKFGAKLGTLGSKGIPIVGPLLDFGIRTLVFGDPPGRAAAGAAGVAVGQILGSIVGTWLGGAIGGIAGSVVPVIGNLLVGGAGAAIGGAIGELIGGFVGDMIGTSLYNFVVQASGDETEMAGGGSAGTRVNPSAGIGRSLKRNKYKRTITPSPKKISPGKVVNGGNKKLQEMFPNPQEGGDKDASKKQNPHLFLIKSSQFLGKANYFGPLYSLPMKAQLGDQITDVDYMLAAKGLNSWMNDTMKFNAIAAAGGGEIDVDSLGQGEDYTRVIAETIKKSSAPQIDKVQKELTRNLTLQKAQMSDGTDKDKDQQDTTDGDRDGISEGGISGTGVNKGISVAKKLISDLGITPAQAAGIVGNFLYESAGMNPAEREGEPYGVPEKPWALGTIGRGYGWAQWTNSAPGDRLDKFLKSYGGDKGKIATDDDNYRFLMTELRGAESLTRKGPVTRTYFPKDDPQAASDWFRQNWERAGVPADEQRRQQTQQVYEKIKGLSREQAKAEVEKSGGRIYSGEDLSSVGRGDPSQASARLLKDFPQIKSRKNNQQIYASGLGFWMKKNFPTPGEPGRRGRGDYGDPPGGDMEHPDHGGVVARHQGQGHNKGKALDLGGFGDPDGKDQDKMWPYIAKFLKIYGLDNKNTVPVVYNAPKEHYRPSAPGSGYLPGHENHLHVEFAKGGETPDSPTTALIGEKGKEYVIDADSYKATEKLLPGLLDILNYDVNDTASLKRFIPTIISKLQQYIPYEEEHIVILPDESDSNIYASSYETGTLTMQKNGIDNNTEQFQVLHML